MYRLQWEERLSSRNSNINALKKTQKQQLCCLYRYCGLTLRADANFDDVIVMKKPIRMAYFNRVSVDEKTTVYCVL